MTREEAINQLKINKQDYTYMMDDDAVDMAIKALEQQDKILQILDDCELEAWEILEKIKEVVRV